jgi:hypothetical protein
VSSHGQQKSLAFTVAWLRQQFRRPNIGLRWTATENMLIDALTKDMDTTHFRETLCRGFWSIEFDPKIVKPKHKAARKMYAIGAELPGLAVDVEDALYKDLLKYKEKAGWHISGCVRVLVARQARSFRSPEPRLAVAKYPVRSSYLWIQTANGLESVRCLEDRVRYVDLDDQHGMLSVVGTLVTLFFPVSSSGPDGRSVAGGLDDP